MCLCILLHFCGAELGGGGICGGGCHDHSTMDRVLLLGVLTTFGMDGWMARGSRAGFAPFAQRSFELCLYV